MRRAALLGLRARLVLVMLATSALTVAVAALALLSPLEHRLRADEIEGLQQSAAVVRPMLRRLPRSAVRPGSTALDAAVRLAAERVDAQVIVVDPNGRLLASSVAQPGVRAGQARRAVADDHSRTFVVGEASNAQATYATPATTGGKRVGLAVSKRLDEVHASAQIVRRAMIVAALIGLGAALLLGLALAARLVRRIRTLRDAALRVARLGPVVEMIPDRGLDEVGDLSRAFVTMQDRLRAQEDARRTFIATASHELRTPLSSLRLMLDLAREELTRERPDVGEARGEVDRAIHQADRLTGLADQLLDLSRLDARTPVTESEPVDLGAAVTAVVHEFTPRAAESGHVLELHVDGGVRAMGDHGRVAQVMRIMLDNALRFAPPGTPVEIRVTPADGASAVRVCDHGVGVPESERELIFERFRRGSETGGEGGFGLGLAIGREVSVRMGGELVLLDAGLSPGACFELRLPAAPDGA